MKLMASGVTCSAASVRSPSFSRSSSSTTTTMRPRRISSSAPGTSVKGGSKVRWGLGTGVRVIAIVSHSRLIDAQTAKAPLEGGAFWSTANLKKLQRRFDLKTPGFKKGLRDVLRILVPASPLPEAGGPDVLVRAELELLYNLLEGGHSGHYGTDRLRFAPIRISTTLCHW